MPYRTMKSWLSRFTSKVRVSPPLNVAVPANRAVTDLVAQGQALEDDGQVVEALGRYREALALQPDSVSALINQGNALLLLSDYDNAIASYRQALMLDVYSASAWLNLGNALMQSPSVDPASRARVLAEAEAAYRAALKARPDWVEAYFGLGCALEAGDAAEEACAAYRRALMLDPTHPGAAFNLADLSAQQLVKRREMGAARKVLMDCLTQQPGQRRLLARLADLERDSGMLHSGLARLRQLVAAEPDDFPVHSVLLFALNYLPEISAQELFAAHQAYGCLAEQSIAPLPTRMACDPNRRLRIGYVSPDLRQHPVSVFLIPILRHHDRRQVEVFCYHNHDGEDEMTRKIRGLSDHWRAVAKLGDDRVAQQIVDDEIDLLIDLAGHTTGGRMTLFAQQPSPVQLTWLGYLGSTGLSRMHYRISDFHTDPVGQSDALHSETLLRLPGSQWCYEPQVPLPAPTPLPYLACGYWTFGSYNNGLKLNEAAFAAWAGVLDAFPDSRLRLFSIVNDALEQWVRASFVQHGISSDRIDCIGRIPIDQYFASASGVDIALDSFPYSGGTTTCDTLMMGLPVVTIAGERTLARSGVSLLNTLGLHEWIASSPQDLPTLLRRQLADPLRIAALREELPARMRNSPLMDAPRFTKNLEQCYREAWQQRCTAA